MFTKKQQDFLSWEFGAFFHFGIRSFYKGHKDWDGLPMDASAFNPVDLNCEQWLETVKEAGATYAILVTKHHDGFANWPSKYSNYSVAQTPWKSGKGDVVREFTDACRKLEMKVGLYYSPAQWGNGIKFTTGKEYDDYFINQISELLTNYGKIDYLWFDACGSEGHEYDKDRIVKVIRSLQPGISIFAMWDPDTIWVGNEDGYAPLKHNEMPAECDCKLRDTWFDCEDNEDKIKSVDELLGMYEMSVGRGANFLLNIGPNARGLLNEADVKRMKEFGDALKARYGNPIQAFGELKESYAADGTPIFSVETAGYEPVENNPAETLLINRVVIEEDLTNGEAIEEFELYADSPLYKQVQICVFRGWNVGHRTICVFPTIRTGRLTVKILKKNHEAKITKIAAFFE